jgi:prepilin-type N-terminal cleavage/methylation domain-containing protein
MRIGRGFTLIELLVVIVIIITLAGLILPVLWRARMASLDTECKNNMKQIGTALLLYRDDYLVSTKEWHPLWLHSLFPDHLKDKECLICPRDGSRGVEGGKPGGCQKQFATLDEGSSYLYEFNMAVTLLPQDDVNNWDWVSYLNPPGNPHEAVNIDGDSTQSKWGEVKAWQLKYGDSWYNGKFGDGKRHAYSPTMFPIVRCFWHTDEPDKDGHLEIHNLSYLCNFFRSGATWEETSE